MYYGIDRVYISDERIQDSGVSSRGGANYIELYNAHFESSKKAVRRRGRELWDERRDRVLIVFPNCSFRK